MTAEALPPRPDLDQLKRQAKELLKQWRVDPSRRPQTTPPRLRDAQRAIAAEYGFPSWDALRAHVEEVNGRPAGSTARPKRRGLDYGDPIHDVMTLRGPLTRDVAQQLAKEMVRGVRLDQSVAPKITPAAA
jgi:hypothetical protein